MVNIGLNRIIAVEPLGGFRLRLRYEGGGVAEVDFTPSIEMGGVCAPMAEPAFFAQVFIGERGRSLEWPGDVGFCADALWFEAHPDDYAEFLREIEQRKPLPASR
jgi:hypothetical protein